MMNLDQIKQRIQRGEEIEKIIEEINWKEFEELVMEILKKHGFQAHRNFRFKTDRRYEIDIAAVKRNVTLTIDCKQWGRGRYKKTGLKYAIQTQKERVNELKKFLKNNIIVQEKLKLSPKNEFISLIITWFEEDLLEHENVLVVPIWKFNHFLLNISEYI